MKILRILVDEIPNEKEYCRFCTVLDDTQERFCTVTEQKCGSRCCLITSDEVQKGMGKSLKEAIKGLLEPTIDSMREIIESYEAIMNEEIDNENKEDNC